MTRKRVQLFGQSRNVEIETEATIGAVFGVNLVDAAGNVVEQTPAQAVAAHASQPDPHPQYLTRPAGPPSVTGSTGGNAALTSLLQALAAAGIITNDTTP